MASIVDERGYNQGFEWSNTQALRMGRRAQAISAVLPRREGLRVLELGCGTGELADELSRTTSASIVGVDLSADFVSRANARFASPTLRYEQADLSAPAALEQLGGDWDAIVGNGILHHLVDAMDEVLPSLKRFLKTGGQLVFWEPNLFNPYVFGIFKVPLLRKLARLEPTEMAFTPGYIEGHLARAGYEAIDVRFRDFLAPVVPFPIARLVASAGDLVERVPGVNRLAQSLFIVAAKG